MARRSPSVVAWVVGPPGLARDVSTHLLATNEVLVGDADDLPSDGRSQAVAVLVEPTDADWSLAHSRGLPIVLVTAERLEGGDVVEAVARGAEAILHRDAPPTRVLRAVMVAARGGTMLDDGQARAVAGALRAGTPRPRVRFTPREIDILVSIERGESVKQTALALGIANKTVENLQGRLFRKLAVRNRAQAVARAHALGIPLGEPAIRE